MEAPVFTLQLSGVDREDVNQEAALLELQGIRPNRAIIRARLQSREPIFNFAPPTAESAFTINAPPLPSPATIEALVDWTLQQTFEVQARLFAFFEDPEENLDSTLRFLQERQLTLEAQTPPPPPTKLPMSQMILRALPATYAELVTMIKEVSLETERPEATVRQFLRRCSKNGTVILDVITDKWHRA